MNTDQHRCKRKAKTFFQVLSVFICVYLWFIVLGILAVYSEPPFYPDKSKLLVVRDADGKEHPVRNAADWAKRREHILANMQLVMGALPDRSEKVPLDVKITDVVEMPT